MNDDGMFESMQEVRKQLEEKYPEMYPNSHRVPQISKVVVHCAVGESGEQLEKAKEILQDLTGRTPILLRAKETVKAFGIREGEQIGWKITLRGEEAYSFLKRVLSVYEGNVWKGSLDPYGNLSFGIQEHQEIPGIEYDPELGIIGFDVSVSFSRKGYRVKKRRSGGKIPEKHKIKKDDAIRFFKTMGCKIREGKRKEREF